MIKLPDTGELRSVHAPVSRSTCKGRWQGPFYQYTETLMARSSMVVYHGCFDLVLGSLGKNSMAADLGTFRLIFFFILRKIYCVYSLESPR